MQEPRAQGRHDVHDADRDVPRHPFRQHVPPPHRPDGRPARLRRPAEFHANSAALTADGLNGTQPQLHYPLDDFGNCLDLPRNEKPVYLLCNGSGPGYGNALGTDPETVGEGEGSSLRSVGR